LPPSRRRVSDCRVIGRCQSSIADLPCHLFADRSRCVAIFRRRRTAVSCQIFGRARRRSSPSITPPPCDIARDLGTNYPVAIARPIMHDIRLQKYHYQSGYGSSLLVRNLDQGGGLLGSPVESSLTESSLAPFFQIHRFPFGDIRRFTNLNSYFGVVTIVAFIFAAIMVLCCTAVSSTCLEY